MISTTTGKQKITVNEYLKRNLFSKNILMQVECIIIIIIKIMLTSRLRAFRKSSKLIIE